MDSMEAMGSVSEVEEGGRPGCSESLKQLLQLRSNIRKTQRKKSCCKFFAEEISFTFTPVQSFSSTQQHVASTANVNPRNNEEASTDSAVTSSLIGPMTVSSFAPCSTNATISAVTQTHLRAMNQSDFGKHSFHNQDSSNGNKQKWNHEQSRCFFSPNIQQRLHRGRNTNHPQMPERDTAATARMRSSVCASFGMWPSVGL